MCGKFKLHNHDFSIVFPINWAKNMVKFVTTTGKTSQAFKYEAGFY